MQMTFEVLAVFIIAHVENSQDIHQNPSNIDDFTGKFLYCTCIMDKHWLSMQIYDVNGGTRMIYYTLCSVFFTNCDGTFQCETH